MKGDKRIIERLNEALFLELGAVNQYWLHYRLAEDWGYTKLAAKERAESIEEMHHADKLITRIIFLGGHPNLQKLKPLQVGEEAREGAVALQLVGPEPADALGRHGQLARPEFAQDAPAHLAVRPGVGLLLGRHQ